ncbi:HNH endonuclease signature motif containing protein [Mycolicibacter minnesotensis]
MFEPGSRVPSAESIARLNALFERRHPSVTPESAALVDRICTSARAENQAAAAHLVAIGELFALRLRRSGEAADWAVDTEAAVAAEVAAALRISQGLAGSRLRYARAMREQLPKVAEVFQAGDIDVRLFQTIVYRTGLIADREVLAAVDRELAATVPRWHSLTVSRLAGRIDKIVAKADADAVRRRNRSQADREISIQDLEGGVSEIHGSLFTPDARAVGKALDALAATVCEHDPRSREQRRADAMGALAVRADRLGCRCGRPDCAAGQRPAASPTVIHVLAPQATVDGSSDEPGWLLEADGFVSPELIAELAKSARQVPLIHPGGAAPEPRYAPSKALADFVRCRDLTCRWPGCDRPAVECDIDHTVPYRDGGPTHASNLKCYCRTHHLVKTFWGWRDEQLPDGTLILTSPSGQTYVTTPGSAWLFPQLCAPTGGPAPPARAPDGPCGDRTAMMPRRRRTRAQHRAARIAAERGQNRRARQVRHAALRSLWFPAVAPTAVDTPADEDPPPF